MSQQTTIRKLAELVNTPVEKLLEQLAEAGMSFSGPDQVVTSIEKVKLLGFLKRSHGKADNADASEAPKKITLNRSRKEELTVGGGKNKATVDVVVRKKVTLVKPTDKAAAGAPVTDERAEILRKLEESRQRNTAEQQKLAEVDKRRAEEAERARLQAEEAARLKAEEAAQRPRQRRRRRRGRRASRRPAHGHGHPKHPAPAVARASTTAMRPSTRPAARTRWSRAWRTTMPPAAFAGQLHLSAQERARRTTGARGKPKPRRQLEQARSGGGAHGFSADRAGRA
jgi:translation initiation factor IF-2